MEVEELWIKVQWDLSEDRNPHCLAPNALDTDDGRRLGLCISTIVNREEVFLWKTINSENACLYANSIVDWLEGKITDLDNHVWPED